MAMKVHKILIVDDDKQIHALIEAALKNTGRFQFMHAYDGQEGLRLFNEDRPSFMILDIDMPVMDGIEVLSSLHLEAKNECPIVVMSGLASHKEQERCLELGATMFMGKPFQIIALQKTINFFLCPDSTHKIIPEQCDNS